MLVQKDEISYRVYRYEDSVEGEGLQKSEIYIGINIYIISLYIM